MKRSLKNLFMIIMILASLIGTSLQASPAEALGAMEEIALTPSTFTGPQLMDLWGFSTDDVYAVGYGIDGTAAKPLIYEKASGWNPLSPDLPGGSWTSGLLEGVWASDATHVYAVGQGTDGDVSKALIYAKGASGWSSYGPTLTGWTAPYLEDVWGSSAANIFAVGVGTKNSATEALIIHSTDGANWTPLTLGALPSGVSHGHLSGVWGSSGSPQHIYAVGFGLKGTVSTPLIYRSVDSGTTWTAYVPALPSTSWTSGQLYAVWGSATNDIYAVGSGSNGGATIPLVYHSTNGTSWTASNVVMPSGWNSGALFGVWGSDATHVYLAGSGVNGTMPLLYRKITAGFNPLSTEEWNTAHFESIWGSGVNDVYAAGYGIYDDDDGVPDPTAKPLLTHAGPDVIAPGAVTSLAAASGPLTGSIDLSWLAPADDAGMPESGPVDSYVVKYSVSPLANCSSGLTVPAVNLPVPVTPGYTQTMTVSGLTVGIVYYFSVCAQDEEGAMSPAVTANAKVYLGVGMYDDTNSNWTYSSGWTTWTGGGLFNNTEHYTGTMSNWAEITFTGTKFILTYIKAPSRGLINVLVDGTQIAQIDAYNYTQVMGTWTSPTLAPHATTGNTHTVRFVHGGAAGKYIDIDAIEVLNTSAPSAVPVGTYDDAHTSWVYSSGWTAWTGSGPLNNTEHYTGTVSNWAEITFTGTKFILTYIKAPSRGLINVLVDGTQIAQINAYNYTQVMGTWTSPTLAPHATTGNTHTVRFVHGGAVGKYIDIDQIEISNAVAPPAVPAGTYDDAHTSWVYSSGWTAWTGSGPLNNTEHYTGTNGSWAELTFTGTKFILTFTKASNRGLIDVIVDGTTIGQINAYSATMIVQSTWSSPVLTPTTGDLHTVRFVHASPTGKYIDIDQIETLTTTTPPAVPAGIYDDAHTNWVYSSGWTAWTGSGPLNNTEHYTGTNGSWAELTFTGVKFVLTFTKASNRGLIDVIVDGTTIGQINAYSATMIVQSTWNSPILTPTTGNVHTVRLVHASPTGKYIDIDQIEALASADPVTVPAGTYEDTNVNWIYSSGWTVNSAEHYTGTNGSSAELTFTGMRFILTFTKASNRGLTDVIVDGIRIGQINSYSAASIPKSTWSSPRLGATSGVHTVEFVHASPTGKYIDIDAIQIMDTMGAGVPAGTYDDTNANWYYSTDWTAWTGSGPLNNTEHYTGTPGSFAEISFTGTQFVVTFTKAASRGLIDVYVDGVKTDTIDAYNSTILVRSTWSPSSSLTAGPHTVRFVHAGSAGTYIDVDSIQIIN